MKKLQLRGADSDVEEYIKSYKRVHSSTMLSILRSYNQWEKVRPNIYKKRKWKRKAGQLLETKAIETILTRRGINFEKIVGKRKK
jgi:hypothetical protein